MLTHRRCELLGYPSSWSIDQAPIFLKRKIDLLQSVDETNIVLLLRTRAGSHLRLQSVQSSRWHNCSLRTIKAALGPSRGYRLCIYLFWRFRSPPPKGKNLSVLSDRVKRDLLKPRRLRLINLSSRDFRRLRKSNSRKAKRDPCLAKRFLSNNGENRIFTIVSRKLFTKVNRNKICLRHI